jgi:hypothetical protein
MATKLSEVSQNLDVTGNESYVSFLNDSRTLTQLEKDFENSNINNPKFNSVTVTIPTQMVKQDLQNVQTTINESNK